MASHRLLDSINEQLSSPGTKRTWRTGLLVVSSAALGGIAVALWNRKSLATLRELESSQAANEAQPLSGDLSFQDDDLL